MRTPSPSQSRKAQEVFLHLMSAGAFIISDSPLLTSWYNHAEEGYQEDGFSETDLSEVVLEATWERDGQEFGADITLQQLCSATFDLGGINLYDERDKSELTIKTYALQRHAFTPLHDDLSESLAQEKHTTFDLHMRVQVALNGTPADLITTRLKHIAEHAIFEAMVTGETDAELESSRISAGPLPDIDAEVLKDFFADRIEIGAIDLENLPSTMAKVGLQTPQQFLEEAQEQMQEIDFGPYADDDAARSTSRPRQG